MVAAPKKSVFFSSHSVLHAFHTKQKNGGGAERAEEEETGEHSQIDEEDMGMSYQELGIYGRLRKIERCVFRFVMVIRRLVVCFLWLMHDLHPHNKIITTAAAPCPCS